MNNGVVNPGQQLPSLSRIKQGLRIFAALTVVGLVFVIYRSSIAESITHLGAFKLRYLALACSLVIVDLIASGARIYVFASRVFPKLSYGSCVRASLANIFLGGVTPSQTGGGPGQIYVLYKEGMHVFDATVVSFVGCFLGTAVFFPVCGLLVTIFAKPTTIDFRLQYVVNASIVVFSLIVFLAVLALVSPERFQAAVRSLLSRVPALGSWLEKKGALRVWFDLSNRYHEVLMLFLTRGKHVFVAGFVLTGIVYFNKFIIAYVVLRGLGVTAGFWEVVYAQLVMMLIFYFSPSPGAAGIAEVSTAVVMGDIIPNGYEGAFVLLWRFFSLYAGLIVGAVVMLRYIYKPRSEAD